MLPIGKAGPSKEPQTKPQGGTAPNSEQRDMRMTAKAGEVPYSYFIAAGWTEADMRAADLIKQGPAKSRRPSRKAALRADDLIK